MGFETYPIPDQSSKIDDVNGRIQSQTDRLLPIITKMYGALDGRLTAQEQANGRVAGKLTRAVNGRVKKQGGALSSITGAMVNSLDSRILEQGQQLAVQSAVLSRFEPVGSPDGGIQGNEIGQTQPRITPGGVRGAAPVPPTVPSLPPGVSAPSFTLSPNEIAPPGPVVGLPPATTPIRQPSPGAGNCFHWIVLVDTARGELHLLCSDDPQFESLIANGAYVPIRYGHDPLTDYAETDGLRELPEGWIGDNPSYQQRWIDIATHAYRNNGDKWPAGGDFPHDPPQTVPHNGLPVGDWPFDSQGNYVGL